jgi:hypothetical protein
MESESSREEIRPIDQALHDLCQPLTTLRIRLELAKVLDTPEDYREAVDVGLAACARLTEAASTLREIIAKLESE